jgi:hypothetical protein
MNERHQPKSPVLEIKDDYYQYFFSSANILPGEGWITNEMMFAKLQILRDILLVRRISSKRNLER